MHFNEPDKVRILKDKVSKYEDKLELVVQKQK
jgi:hypothetical protein